MKSIIVLAALLGASACAPSGVWTSNHGQPAYEYVGCHNVTVNPNPDTGEIAFGPFGVATDKVFFKQISKDGSVGKVTTAKPC